jgi:hypothetical protein
MMRKYLFLLWLFAGSAGVNAQVYVSPTNYQCTTPWSICQDTTQYFGDQGAAGCIHSPLVLWYSFNVNAPASLNLTFSSANNINYLYIYGPFTTGTGSACSIISSGSAPVAYSTTTPSTSINYSSTFPAGQYLVALHPSVCISNIDFTSSGTLDCGTVQPCTDCIPSFSLTPNKKYIVSCWVKEDGAGPNTTAYTNPSVSLNFPTASTTLGPFTATGQIIDGWQRIEAEFTVPNSATDLEITLDVNSGSAYFDDIRVFPYDGVMTTYVFDPITLRLVAQLDERNYATIYEYDKEGKLIRVKKETEKGIMTIQENKTSMKK